MPLIIRRQCILCTSLNRTNCSAFRTEEKRSVLLREMKTISTILE